MIKNAKKYLGFIIILITILSIHGAFLTKTTFAELESGGTTGGFTNYKPLIPLPIGPNGSNETPTELSKYLPAMFQFFIGIAGVLAVVMIVIGGIQYMSTDAVYGKSAGKEKIAQALGGLLLAIVAWLILYSINPNLLNTVLGGPNTQMASSTPTNPIPHTARVTYHVQNTYGPPTTECKSTYPSPQACAQSLTQLEASYPTPPYANVSVGCDVECNPTPPPPPYSLMVTYHVQGIPGPPKVACYPYTGPVECQTASENFDQSDQPTWIIHNEICTQECTEQ